MTTPILRIEFSGSLGAAELPAFRGALSQQAGPFRDYFHNHRNPEGGFHYRYPLIQYKRMYEKPALLCIGAGAEEVQEVFEQGLEPIQLNGRRMELKVHSVRVQQVRVQTWDHAWTYRLHNWIGLNGEYHTRWKEAPGLGAQIAILEKSLVNQLVGFCKALDSLPEAEIRVAILHLQGPRTVRYKGMKFHAFDLEFRSNLYLPDYIGLGRGAGLGFGTVKQVHRHKEQADA